ncbi:hypothetical protein IAT40_001276 [Kwoniella sp. CBS 6097]
MVKSFAIFLALAPALILGLPQPQDDTSTSTSASTTASSASSGAGSTSTSSSASTSASATTTGTGFTSGSGSASSSSATSSGSHSSSGTTSGSGTGSAGIVAAASTSSATSGSASGSASADASSTSSGADPEGTGVGYNHDTIVAISKQEFKPVNSTKSQGRVAGEELKPKCQDLYGPPEEDWLYTALCGMLQVSPKGVLDNIWSTVTTFNLTNEAADLAFRVYDSTGKNISAPVKFKDAVAKGVGSRDPDKAWFGSGFRQSILKLPSGELITTDQGEAKFSIERNEEWAAWYGLAYLTGIRPARDDPTAVNSAMWSLWMEQSKRTPVVIKASSDATDIVKDRHYTVYDADPDANVATVWNPSTLGPLQFINVTYDALQAQSQWIFHLDWAAWDGPYGQSSKQ